MGKIWELVKLLDPEPNEDTQGGKEMSQNGFRLCEEVINPEKAEMYLSSMTVNRRVRPFKVRQFADDMRNGRWLMNAEPIRIDRNGCMFDGQHRCLAIIQSQTAQRVVVASNLDPSVRCSVDIGSKRTLGDELRMEGEKNYCALSAAIQWLWKYENGVMENSNTFAGTLAGLEILEKHPELRESVRMAHDAQTLCSTGLAAFVHYMARREDKVLADMWLNSLITGLDCGPLDPVYKLRQRLIKNRVEKAKLRGGDVAALMIKSWNATLCGTKPKFLKQTNRGDAREPYPRFIENNRP